MILVRMVLTIVFLSAAACMAQDSPPDSTGFPTLTGPYVGQEPPGMAPVQFAPDIIPIEDIEHCFPTFSPDGREVFWMTIKRGSKPKIMHMKEIDGKYLFIGRFIEGQDGTDAFFWMDGGIIDSLRAAGTR